MLDRLEQNFEAERQFTSDASHELRTPVAVILAQCEYALENARGEEELCEAISAIERQGRRISRLIESLLSFTRLEQGTAQLNWEQLDLSAPDRFRLQGTKRSGHQTDLPGNLHPARNPIPHG